MAKALQCPACGRKHPVATLPDAPTFPCSGCGQSLKVPAQFRGLAVPPAAVAAKPDAPAAASPAHSAPPSPPVSPPVSPPPSGGTAVLPPVPDDGPRVRAAAPPPVPRVARPRPSQPETSFLRRLGGMPFRLLAWVVAIALGGIITVSVARTTGWLSGQRLVDVFTGTGISRYLRVMAIVPVWAIVTTLLVTLIVEGTRWLARARRVAQAQRAANLSGTGPMVDNGGSTDDGERAVASSVSRSSRTPAGRSGR